MKKKLINPSIRKNILSMENSIFDAIKKINSLKRKYYLLLKIIN